MEETGNSGEPTEEDGRPKLIQDVTEEPRGTSKELQAAPGGETASWES